MHGRFDAISGHVHLVHVSHLCSALHIVSPHIVASTRVRLICCGLRLCARLVKAGTVVPRPSFTVYINHLANADQLVIASCAKQSSVTNDKYALIHRICSTWSHGLLLLGSTSARVRGTGGASIGRAIHSLCRSHAFGDIECRVTKYFYDLNIQQAYFPAFDPVRIYNIRESSHRGDRLIVDVYSIGIIGCPVPVWLAGDDQNGKEQRQAETKQERSALRTSEFRRCGIHDFEGRVMKGSRPNPRDFRADPAIVS